MEIILNPIGGLANRMRAIASGISFSIDNNVKIKSIEWAINSELHCPFQELFEPVSNNIKVNDISNLRKLFFLDNPRKQNLYISKLFQFNRANDKIVGFIPDISVFLERNYNNKKPVIIQSGYTFYNFTPELYRKIFIPKKHIIQIADDRIKNHPRTIGLHIRRTDNKMSIENSPIELFIDKINYELDIDRNTKFYLATDDENTKRDLYFRYADKIIFSDSKASRNTKEGIMEALVEMLCLSSCCKIYGSFWSSFSEAAALIGNTELIQLKK